MANHTDYGPKNLYFMDYETRERFIELYEDLFTEKFRPNHYCIDSFIREINGEDHKIYYLKFYMNHNLWRKIQKNLEIKRVVINKKYPELGYRCYKKHVLMFEE